MRAVSAAFRVSSVSSSSLIDSGDTPALIASMMLADLPSTVAELAPCTDELRQVLATLPVPSRRQIPRRTQRTHPARRTAHASHAGRGPPTSCRLMLRRLVQVPRDRALKHTRRSCDERSKPPPQTSHFVSPENRYFGRRARTMPALTSSCGWTLAAPSTACQRSSSMMRSSGTSFVIHTVDGFSRAMALSGVRILHEALAIPDQAADVKLVVEDASPSARVTVNRAGAPRDAARSGDAFRVQGLGDRLRRHASHEGSEDPPDDRGLLGIDLSLAAWLPIEHSSEFSSLSDGSRRGPIRGTSLVERRLSLASSRAFLPSPAHFVPQLIVSGRRMVNVRGGAPIQTAVATSEDLAILWSFIGGLRCVLTPVVGGWQIRIEDDRETVRSHVSRTSQEALAIAAQWLKNCPGGTLRNSRDT